MQRWFPAYAGAVAALYWATAAVLGTQVAWSAETSWDPMFSEPASTLGSQVAPQNLDLPSSALELVVRGTANKLPRLISAQSGRSPTQSKHTKPIKHPKQSSPSKPIASPFAKWVSPKASVSKPGETHSAELPEASVATEELQIPQRVARRIPAQRTKARAPTRHRNRSNPSPPSAQPDSNLASKSKPTKKRSSAKPKSLPTKGLPTPHAALTIKPPRVDLANLPPLTKGQQRLRGKIRQVLSHYHRRPFNSRDRGPWEMMHAMLAYETESQILRGGPRGEPITAVGWLCFNQTCRRRTLMYVNEAGEMRVRVGPALQGHEGQLLAMLAQSKVSKDYPMRIEGHDFTVGDLVKMEMETCYPRTELTFKLIALSHYLKSNATWMNDRGMKWDIPKLISEELRQPVRGAACGGTHRLSGLTLAYKARQKRGEPIDGQYLKAQKFVARYQQYAYRLQNRDGSFSTEWFRGSGNKKDIERNLKTTGHLLEWLLYAANENELRSQKTARAANYLATIMMNNRSKDWEAGPLGHAIHALLLYDRLIFSPYEKAAELPVAGKTKRSALN